MKKVDRSPARESTNALHALAEQHIAQGAENYHQEDEQVGL